MARVEILQHVAFEGPGAIAPWLTTRAHQIHISHLYQNASLPPPSALDWLIVMGGPMGVHDETECSWLAQEKTFIRECIDAGKVVLGICLGAQLIAHVLGATVTRNAHTEIGWFPVRPCDDHELAQLFADAPTVLHWHGDTFAIPAGARHLCRSDACDNQAFLHGDRVLGLQFHLESTAESLAQLCHACGHELVPSQWVQDAATLQGPASNFRDNQQRLANVLAWLARRLPPTP